MPNWKKIALSGSNPEFSSLIVDNAISASAFTGSFTGDGSGLTGLSVTQTATISDTFTSTTSKTVTHNFGTKNVIVQVYDNSDNIIIPQSITTSTTSSVDIVLDSTTTGRVVVAKGGHIISGSVDFNSLSNTPTLLSSSAQIATDISGSFTAASSSISTRLTTAESELSNTLISSSAQIATDISGSSSTLSSSLASRVAANELFSSSISTTPITYTGSFVGDGTSLTGVTSYTDSDTLSYINSVGVLSGSAQIAANISGSFTATSASIASDIANISTDFADITNKPTLLSGSAQIATDISGSFTAASASISTRITTEETNVDNLQSFSSSLSTTIITYTGSFSGDGSNLTGITAAGTLSSSAQIASDISGSLSATAIAALGADILSGSGTLFSQSFSSATAVTASHNFGTKDVVVSTYDSNDNLFFPTNIQTFDTNNVHISFNVARTGRVVVSKGGHVLQSAANAATASFASTGPFLSNTGGTVDGDLTLTGTLTAQTYIVSSSVTYMTQSFSSGSTIFGDSLDDTHLFTGSLNVTGSANLVASQSVNNNTSSGSLSFWQGSESEYNAISNSADNNTIYFVV